MKNSMIELTNEQLNNINGGGGNWLGKLAVFKEVYEFGKDFAVGFVDAAAESMTRP